MTDLPHVRLLESEGGGGQKVWLFYHTGTFHRSTPRYSQLTTVLL